MPSREQRRRARMGIRDRSERNLVIADAGRQAGDGGSHAASRNLAQNAALM